MRAAPIVISIVAAGLLAALAPAAAPLQEIELRLLLVDEQGDPVADATVDVWDSAADAGASPHLSAYKSYQLRTSADSDRNPRDAAIAPEASFHSASNGHAVIRVKSTHAVFVASKAELGSSGVWYAEAVVDEANSRIVVTLHDGGFIGGTVLNADETPAAGVTVTFREMTFANEMNWYGDDAGRGIARCPPTVSTDHAGRFQTRTDPRYRGPAFAIAEDGTRSSVEIVAALTHPAGHATLRFPGRFRVRGVARDPNCTPLPGIEITFRRSLHEPVSTTTDDEGRFDVDLFTAGTFDVSIDTQIDDVLILDRPLRVVLTEEAPSAEVEVAFVAAATLRGRVLAPKLDQHKHAMVRSRPEPSPNWPLSFIQASALGTMSKLSPDGTFSIPVHPRWSYRLECNLNTPAGLSQVREGLTADGEEIRFEFTGRYLTGASVQGTVVDGETGASIADASVVLKRVATYPGFHVMDDSGAHATNLSGGGSYDFSDVLINHLHAIEVSAPGYATQLVGPIDLTDADDHRVIALQRTATLTIELPDVIGAPQAEQLPTLRHLVLLHQDTAPMPSQPFFRLVQTVLIEENDPVVIRDLPPGPFVLQLFEGLTASALLELELEPGAAITVRPDPLGDVATGSLDLEGRDRFDRPLAGVQLSARWHIGRHASESSEQYRRAGRTDEHGRLSFEDLTEGIWSVAFSDSDIAITEPLFVLVRPGERLAIVLRSR